MKTIYFPFTYVSSEVAICLRRFFSAVVGYQPGNGSLPEEMEKVRSSGFWEVIAPDTGNEKKLKEAVRGLLSWGEIHQGGMGAQSAYAQLSGRGNALEDQEAEAWIAAEIRQRSRSDTIPTTADPLFSAQLFLQLAQDFDRQCSGLQRDLERQDRLAANLRRAIGAEAIPDASPGGLHAPGRRTFEGSDFTAKRVKAWSRVYLSHPYPSPVFVTFDPEVLEYLMEQVPETPFMTAALPGPLSGSISESDQGALLLELAATPPDALQRDFGFRTTRAVDRRPGAAALWVVTGTPPLDFFARLIDAAGRRPERVSEETGGSHTLLAVVVPDFPGE